MSHCTHWTSAGEECCDCGQIFPHSSLCAITSECPGEPLAVHPIPNQHQVNPKETHANPR